MSCSIEISRSAAEKLKGLVPREVWPAVEPEIVDRLDRLGANPRLGVRLGTEWGPLEGRLVYPFRVTRPPLSWRFTVVFQFSEDEERIVITDVIRTSLPPVDPE